MIPIVLMSIISIINLLIGIRNTKKAFWINYLFFLALPIGSYGLGNTDKFFQINSFQITEIGIVILFIICIIKLFLNKKVSFRLVITDVIMIWISIIMIFILYYSYGKEGNLALIDGKRFVLHIIIYFMARINVKETEIERFFDITLIGSIINSIIILGFYLYATALGYQGRFGFGSQSIYMITIPYIVYKFMYFIKGYKKSILFIGCFILESYLFILTGNRTNIIAIIGGIIVTILLNPNIRNFRLKNYIKEKIKTIAIIGIMILILIFGLNFIMNSQLTIIQRYKEIIQNGVTDELSYQVRTTTKEYYEYYINKDPLKVRVGEYMPHIYPTYTIEESADLLQTDNNFLVIKYKLGIIPFILYFTVYILVIAYILQCYYKNKENKYLYVLSLCLLSYIGVGIMTSQIFHTISIYSFYIVLTAVIINAKNKQIMK